MHIEAGWASLTTNNPVLTFKHDFTHGGSCVCTRYDNNPTPKYLGGVSVSWFGTTNTNQITVTADPNYVTNGSYSIDYVIIGRWK